MSKLYAIGDIHGCLKELNVLLNVIEKEVDSEDLIIFVGDYIDRGEDSRGCIERLIQLKKAHSNTVFLKGNHEDMMLDFLNLGGSYGEWWIANGGDAALESYGAANCWFPRLDGGSYLSNDEGWTAKGILGKEHLEFFTNLVVKHETDNYIFVHAGFNLLHPRTSERDNMWVRDEWLGRDHDLGKTVIHGHTPQKQGVSFNQSDGKIYAINVDTGCVFGGSLSCIKIDDINEDPIKAGEEILSVDKGAFSVKRNKVQ